MVLVLRSYLLPARGVPKHNPYIIVIMVTVFFSEINK
jgi:hypothetical protein